MTRANRRAARSWTVLAAALVLAGCASGPVAPPVTAPSPTETIVHGDRHDAGLAQPGPFVVRYDLTELRLQPYTYCVSNGCADGFDDDPPSVGSPEELLVFVPVREFDRLHVGQVEGGDPCVGRSVEAEVAEIGEGWWSVRPRGPAAEYVVDLFASGEGAGDMIASLRWMTPRDEPLPDPTATLTAVVDHDGVPDSYGLELAIGNLAASPVEYSATITVTASNGQALTFPAVANGECRPDGSLYFDEPDAEAKRASSLGDFPFTYRVQLILDGVTHVATATYPDDLVDPQDVAVPLHFEPRLP
ncbi:hypothetical protein [Microbacterium pumilum]|uniref:Uncharacterized protein n=1 Tax=Microbacterium pumilum TaxID=344165 RepID=A0ABN2S0N2_9MICO